LELYPILSLLARFIDYFFTPFLFPIQCLVIIHTFISAFFTSKSGLFDLLYRVIDPLLITSLILATITLTFPLNNVILLFNFPPIILILAFLSLVFNSISITLLILIIYPPPMSILLLVNGPPVMYPSFFNYRNRSLSHDFGLLMNHLALSIETFPIHISPVIYPYPSFSQPLIYRSLSNLSPHSFSFNLGFNRVGNLVSDNSLFTSIVFFPINGMININLLFYVIHYLTLFEYSISSNPIITEPSMIIGHVILSY